MKPPSPRDEDLSLPSSPGKAGTGDSGDPLDVLAVIDRLEVDPPVIRKDRVSSAYRVVRGAESHEMELVYRYEEPVFDPEDLGSISLASMIVAQVALNYGLVCKQIVLRGSYDAKDRRFLRAMLSNTAREIYVKKFLESNPFVIGPAKELPVTQKRDYARAELLFDGNPSPSDEPPWSTAPDRFGVLSSGGKDSLLSLGLLRELGRDVHPIFVNESGRHWYTALNAYRELSRSLETTARVWTNADRLFSWMLRHLPFIRDDFHRLRSDEYPVRLWTVAVFLFGALPILRRRGIGRLVIGDEYDTTVRTRHEGIVHYDGLYDQSRYFDDAMTRYFRAKGWKVTQLSLLRPMSELLIQKTLAERYPPLLKLQVSCHATHMDGETVRPCGRCEKCRRIIGMLLALRQDPGACGYDEDQVTRARGDLVKHGVHQERAGAEHLAWLLHRDGHIEHPRLGAVKAREHPEITRLRFDSERSPTKLLPIAERQSILGLLAQNAQGAVERSGSKWVELDPMTDPRLQAKDMSVAPTTPSSRGAGSGASDNGGAQEHVWGEQNWPTMKRRLRRVDVALLPVGAIEQHGPHLPLDTDSFDAEYLARAVAQGCRAPRPFLLPLIPYGVSYHHDDFAGTLSIRNRTLADYVYDVGMGLARSGIKKLIIVNGHGGNGPALHFAAQAINCDAHIFTCVETGETSDPDIYAMIDTANDVHAGEIETSTSLAIRPELVHMEKAKGFVPRFSTRYLDFTHKRSVGWYARTSKISSSGVLGDPSLATKEKGEAMWKVMVDCLVEFVEHIKELSLADIYERRY